MLLKDVVHSFLVLAAASAVRVGAFAVQRPRRPFAFCRSATIYYNPEEYCAVDDCGDGEADPQLTRGGDTTSGVASSALFLQSPDVLASLARLAVAFGPHKMAMNQIEHVEVTGFDTNHLDLQVVICEDECLTLMVPVPFPTPCTSTEEEECFLDNIHQLDDQATAQIRRWEWEDDHHELISARAREYEVLMKVTDGYPDWWQKSGSMSRDCSSLQRLLNEPDFRQEIKAIAARSLAADSQYDMYEIDQVAVAAVGPAGLIVKASAYEISILANVEENESGAKANTIFEMPLPFSSLAQDISGLHAAVLQAVAVASEFMDA